MLFVGAAATVRGEDARVIFDVPDKIECRDVTPAKCAVLHPTLKVVEAKFRISASFAAGSEASAVDFTYMISSPKMRLKILDYLPNTTLESRYADDRIEVADFSEEGGASTQEARVGYSIFSLNAVQSQFNRKTEENHYQRVAPKSLVLASGTMNRGHGVFYKLRPSNAASLEGAKEFTFLAVVPRTWRADWCTFVCAARSEKKSLLSSSIVSSGLTKVDVGLYLCGDEPGSALAAELCSLQEQNDGAVVKHATTEAAKAMEAAGATPKGIQLVGHVDDLFVDLLKKPYASKTADDKLASTLAAVAEVQAKLGGLSGGE
jgi:hypothetical protein